MNSDGDWRDRQGAELELLQAMYPGQVRWHKQRQECIYSADNGAVLNLRLSDGYPGHSTPMLLSASNSEKHDIREPTRQAIDRLDIPEDEEMLDAVIQAFEVVAADSIAEDTVGANHSGMQTNEEGYKTTVVWLHHLLNTNKRKLATNPTSRSAKLVGVTKPGYPGVLIYSGRTGAVDSHVAELRAERWQAFQIRMEQEGRAPWSFTHSVGIVEVEGIAEVTSSISEEANKLMFLQAMNIK